MSEAAPESTQRNRRRIVGWTALGLLVAIIAAAVWVGTRAWIVRDELTAVAALQDRATAALQGGDVAALGDVVAEFDVHSHAASGAAGDPLWRAAEALPWAGANLAAVRTVADQLAVVSDDVATPLLEMTEELASSRLVEDHALDVDLVAAAREPLGVAQATLTQASAAIAAVPRAELIDQVGAGVDDLDRLLGEVDAAVSGMLDLTEVLPGMLGADGPRTILVMLQNNAELRSGGGITGSFAQLVAEDGSLALVRQADSSRFARTKEPVVPLPDTTTALYGDIVGRYVQNATTTPDFDLSARLAVTWWKGLTGVTPDVVVAVDPIVLRSLLAVTGPVTLAGGEVLTPDGFVDQVMVRPYLELDPKAQTRYFQDLTQRFFTGLMSSDADPSVWISALRGPVEQGRISVWSADGDEAAVLATTAFAGPLAAHAAAGEDAFTAYLNDTTGAKMDSSLAVALAATTGSCRSDGRQEVLVRVTLTNEAPADAGTRWPYSMTGSGRWGVTAGHIGTAVAVAAPAGWFFGGTSIDGVRRGSIDVVDGGFPTSAIDVTLAPGEMATLAYRFVSPDDADAPPITPEVRHTPLMRAPEESGTSALVCD